METYDEDFRYIAQKLNSTTLLSNANERKGGTSAKISKNQSQTERIKEHFSLLDKEARQRLYQLYRIDFEMFGFDATSYL